MTIFYIVSGVCVVGIIIALWLLQQEASRAKSGIQKVSPEEIKNYDPYTETIVSAQGATATQAPPKTAAKPKKPRFPSQGLFGGKKGAGAQVRLDAIEAAPDMPEGKPKKKSFFKGLSLGKSRPSPLDDIPKPTTFPGLHKEQKDEPLPAEQGTAAMTTQHTPPGPVPEPKPAPQPAAPPPSPQPVLPIQEEMEKTKKSAAGSQNDASSRQREHLAMVQLDEWKQKYERLDRLFQEKSGKYAEAESQLANEMKNRDDFFKLKTILENEIQEVKDRARDLQNTLKNAQLETEQQKVQAQQLRDKVRILEDEIQQKNEQLQQVEDTPAAADSPSPGLPLRKLIEQNEREEAARKEGSPDQDPMVNLPQDQKTESGANSVPGESPGPQEPSSADPQQDRAEPGPDTPADDKRF